MDRVNDFQAIHDHFEWQMAEILYHLDLPNGTDFIVLVTPAGIVDVMMLSTETLASIWLSLSTHFGIDPNGRRTEVLRAVREELARRMSQLTTCHC